MARKTTGKTRAASGKAKNKAATRKKPTKKKKTATRVRKKKGGSFPWSVLLAAILTFIIGIILVILLGDRLKVSIPDEVKEKRPPVVKAVKGTHRVLLYVSNSDGKSLKALKARIQKGPPADEARAIIKRLLKGPEKGSPLASPIPKGTRLLSVKIKGSNATLDFSKELYKNHPGGSSAELQTIYAIVNSIALNIDGIKTVRILIDGKGRETLAGHIVISIPLSADKKILSK
ncbi:hypothetical protein MNBD_DELTA01-139 [hydrothermal vent metagenome]|uniref:GerMN domain-containing protein n=1 Tax=hydrothermal vent metagenome TaxID=652676 RepID=A0A3B0R211_9ZZZZ